MHMKLWHDELSLQIQCLSFFMLAYLHLVVDRLLILSSAGLTLKHH